MFSATRARCATCEAYRRPPAMDRLFLPSCSPPSPRHGASVAHLAAARGAVTRPFRFSRRDAHDGRRRSRLCTVASDLRLLMPASSPTSAGSGGLPPWARHELLCVEMRTRRFCLSAFAGRNRAKASAKRLRSRGAAWRAAWAAHRRDGFTAGVEPADKARRATGAGRGKAGDVPRRRKRPTTSTSCRWTKPFRRDSAAAPQQMAQACAAIGFRQRRKARCRVRIDAGRSTRRADRTCVRPPGDTGKARRDYHTVFRATDGCAHWRR